MNRPKDLLGKELWCGDSVVALYKDIKRSFDYSFIFKGIIAEIKIQDKQTLITVDGIKNYTGTRTYRLTEVDKNICKNLIKIKE